MDVKEEDDETDNSKSQDESGHEPVAQKYGHIQGTDDIVGSEAKHKDEEEDSTKTDSRDSRKATGEMIRPEMFKKAHSEDQKKESSQQRLSGKLLDSAKSDSFVAMDSKGKEGEEKTETTKSQDESGNESAGEDVHSGPVDQVNKHIQSIAVSNSGAEQSKKQERPAKTIGDKTHVSDLSTESSKQRFVDCSTCVCRDSKHVMEVKDGVDNVKSESSKSMKAAGHSEAKPEDEPSKTPTDFAVAIRDEDPAEEVTELEIQSEDQSLESPRQEISDRILDNSDSIFEAETCSKSLDESGNDSSVEDVNSDIVAQEFQKSQRSDTDVRSQGKRKEEFPKPTAVTKELLLREKRMHPHHEDWPEHLLRGKQNRMIFSDKPRTVEEEEAECLMREKQKRIFLYEEKLREEAEEAKQLQREKEKRKKFQQELLRKKEEEMALLERELETHPRKEKLCLDMAHSKRPKECLFYQKELKREETGPMEKLKREHEKRLCHHPDQMSKKEEKEMERLRYEKEMRISRQMEAIQREEEKEALQLMKDKETRIRRHQEALGKKEEEEMARRDVEMKKRTHLHKEKLLTDFDRSKNQKESSTHVGQEKHEMRNKEEEAEQLKWQKEMKMHPCQEENMIEQLRHDQEIWICRQKEELMKEEKEEVARLKREKETRICRQRVELRREEEEEVEQLKREKETRLHARLEELRKGEEEEEEWLKREMDMRKCSFQEELNRAQREAEQLMREKQMEMQFYLEVLRKEEEEEAEQLRREKEKRICQQKEKLMKEEQEQVARLKKETEKKIRRCLDELSRVEEEEARQLKREKEMRMQVYQEKLQREEEDEAQILKREKGVRFSVSHEQQLREEEEEEEKLKEYFENRNRLLEEELRRDKEKAEQMKREKAKIHLHRQEELKRLEAEKEQLAREKWTRLQHEDLRREEEENNQFMREKNLRKSLLMDQLNREEEEEVARLRRAKEMRMRHYQEVLMREEEDELESLKRKQKTRMCLHQDVLRREEEKEVDQLERERRIRMHLCPEDPRGEKVQEVEKLRKEKALRTTHQLQKGPQDEERENAERKNLQFSREGKEAERLKGQMQLHLGQLWREEDKAKQIQREKAKSWPRRKEHSARKEVKGLFSRETETQTMLRENEPRRGDVEGERLKRESMTFSNRQEGLRKEDEAEKWTSETKLWLRPKGEQCIKDTRNKKVLYDEEPRSEHQGVVGLKREMSMSFRQEAPSSEQDESEKWYAEKTKSWPRTKEHSIKKEPKGLFVREMKTQTMDHEKQLQSEDEEVEWHLKEALRREEDEAENSEREMTQSWLSPLCSTEEESPGQFKSVMETRQSWPSQECSTEDEAEGPFTRGMEARKMLPGQERRSDDDILGFLRRERRMSLCQEDMRRDQDELEKLERWKTKSWPRRKEHGKREDSKGLFMREMDTQTILNKEELKSEDDEVEHLKGEKILTFLRKDGLRSKADEAEKLEREKTKGKEEKVKWPVLREMETQTMLQKDQLGREDERFKAKTQFHPEELMSKEQRAKQFEREKAKSWPRRKEHGKREEAKGLFVREMETPAMLRDDKRRREDEEVERLKGEKILTLQRKEGPRRKEDEAEKMEREMTKGKEENAKWPFIRDKQTMLQDDQLRREDERFKEQRQLPPDDLMSKEHWAKQFEREKAKSWPRRKEHGTKKYAKGLFMREMETPAMLRDDKLGREDEDAGWLRLGMRTSHSEDLRREDNEAYRHLERERTKSWICQKPFRKTESPKMLHEDEVRDEEGDMLGSSGDEESTRERPRVKDRTWTQREGSRGRAEQLQGVMRENETRLQQELRSEDDEDEEKVDFLKRQRRISLFDEELRREEEEEVEQLQRERDTRMRKYEEKLRRDEEMEADHLKREKEQRIRRLQAELKVEEEDEAESLKKDKEKRMRLLREEMQKEEEEERFKWENERSTRFRQEGQSKHEEEEEQFKRPEGKKKSVYFDNLRTEETEKRAQETARKGKDKTSGHLQEDPTREAELQVRREKERRTPQSQETKDEEIERFQREKGKMVRYSQEGLKRAEGEEEEELKTENENRMGRLQDELKRETEELIDKLKAEKQKRMRLRQIDIWGEEEERKLKTEYKERLRALRQYLLVKRREEETLLNRMFEEKERLTESAWMERDEGQFQLRQDREAAIRALCLALEEDQEAENDRLKTQRSQFFERLKAESEEELHALRARLQKGREEKMKFSTPGAHEKSFDPGLYNTFYPLNGAVPDPKNEIFGAFRPPPQWNNTTHFSAYTPTLAAPRPTNTMPTYTATHPSLSTPESLFCHPRATMSVDPFVTTSLGDTYLANTPIGYCDQLSLNTFNEITVYRFQRQNAQWSPPLPM
ncbi:trichohyalin-like isoform X2 [Hippocampus zosterae]|uniref:trichohyalin-like isoform X2 n=1 Tax=Hippocampus zosterae TaxID=109293 RepID=UPI00223CABA3|nr:trichohyalin-like isoform X2 [Hippocampus zosterae]